LNTPHCHAHMAGSGCQQTRTSLYGE
jgi:hypothetical protein